MKKIVLVLLIILLLPGCSSTKSDEISLQEIKERKKIILGTSPDYPPFEFYDSATGEIVGFDISIAKAIAEELGVELEIKTMSFDMLVESIKHNNVDFVLAGMSPTDKRREVITFSDIYFDNEMVFLVKRDKQNNIDTKDTLKSATIGAQMGSIHTIDQAESNGEISKVIKLSYMNELVQNLLIDSVDGVIIGKQAATKYLELHPELTTVSIPIDLQIEGMAIALAQNTPELNNFINDCLKKFKNEGLFDVWMYDAYSFVESDQ